MSLSTAISTGSLDSNGNPILATYWKLCQFNANSVLQTFHGVYYGFASATAFNDNPLQAPLLQFQINYPDPANVPGASWPFSPAALSASFPGNPEALLLAAEAYAMQYPFFSGATQVP